MNNKQKDEQFGVGPLVHNGELYDFVNNIDVDFAFYKKWAHKVQGSVLELCAGTGRLTIPLKESGINIIGIDKTVSMINQARKKAKAKDLSLEFIKDDMRTFELNKRFSLIFIPFNSLQNIYSISDVENTFKRIKHHLYRKGLFIFDVFNPSIHFMVNGETNYVEQYRFTKEDGIEVVISEKCKYDPASQINRVKWKYEIGGNEFIEQLDMRCFYPLEMDTILKYNGFKIIEKFGDYNETPFKSESPKQIYVCNIQ